jgi:hypothetical protein
MLHYYVTLLIISISLLYDLTVNPGMTQEPLANAWRRPGRLTALAVRAPRGFNSTPHPTSRATATSETLARQRQHLGADPADGRDGAHLGDTVEQAEARVGGLHHFQHPGPIAKAANATCPAESSVSPSRRNLQSGPRNKPHRTAGLAWLNTTSGLPSRLNSSADPAPVAFIMPCKPALPHRRFESIIAGAPPPVPNLISLCRINDCAAGKPVLRFGLAISRDRQCSPGLRPAYKRSLIFGGVATSPTFLEWAVSCATCSCRISRPGWRTTNDASG